MKEPNAIARHQDRLPSSILEALADWRSDSELDKLVSRLEKSTDERFFDTYTEIQVAYRLLQHGCRIAVEVPTPRGRSADFRVLRDELSFFIHVKRSGLEGIVFKHLNISKRVRDLERIERPLAVHLSFRKNLDDQEMQYFVKEAATFLRTGQCGERKKILSKEGTEFGECIIDREVKGTRVKLEFKCFAAWASDGFKRFYALMRDAYKQFMPDTLNVILVTSGYSDDAEDFNNALLGTECVTLSPDFGIEKTERLGDGFWSKQKHSDSQVAGWIAPSLGQARSHIYFRCNERIDPALRSFIQEVLGMK
jgi:hypothetical protein